MGFRCAVYGCGNIPKEKEISLHEFPPKSDRKRHVAWTNFISRTRDKWIPTVSCHVCSEHFFESDFENKLQFHMGFAKKLVLKKDAVPSVYPKCEGDPSSTASSRGTSHSCSQTDDSHGQSAVQIRRVYRKPYLRINLEQSGDSPQDGIISKFSESDGEVQDCSEHDVVKIKNEEDPKKYVNPGSEVLSGKNELTFIKEEPLHSNFEFTKTEEEQEERYYEVRRKIQNPGVRIKTEQSDHSPQNHIISKFSENNNEVHDCTYCDVLSLKKEPEEGFQQINSEGLSDRLNNDKEKKFSGYHNASQKSSHTETQNYKFLESSSGDGFDKMSSMNTFVRMKMEQCGDSPQNGIISKFSERDDDVQGCSICDISSLKNEVKEEMQQISSGLESSSGTGNSVFVEENLSSSSFDFKVTKEERSNEVPMKIKKTFIKIKTEQSDHSRQNYIISKFIESDDEVPDYPKHNVLTLKKEPEEGFQQINLEDLSETRNCESMKSSSGGGFHEMPSRTNNHKKQKCSHNGNKPYSCIMCSKKFGRKYHLKEHMRTHTGEKPYECVVCGKQFLSNGNLKTHQRIHTGEKPYSCVVCGREFRSNSHLKRHKKLHIVEDP